MTDQQASTAGSEDEKSGQDEDDNDDSATEIEEEAADDGVVSDKEPLDLSSDESQKTQHSGLIGNQKNEKKTVQRFKPKVKIKTLTIDGQLVYFCKICDKIFTRRKDKLNHELAHSGESVLTCTECGKEYLHESSLASHMRTHDGDPLFMCDLCPKMFAQSHHLKTHILSHSEPTNFVCKTCYTEFPTAADLNYHNRTQIKLEMTKYWCKMCKVYLCRNHELNCDNRLHAFCCSACNELFYTHKKLKIHMKKFAHFSVEKSKAIEPLQEHELYPFKASDAVKKAQAQKENELVKQSQKSNIQPEKRPSEDNAENEVPSKKFKLSHRKSFLDGDQSSTSLQESAAEIKKELETDLKSPCKHRKPYCKKCNRSYKDSSELDRHKALVHEEKQDVFQCENCNMEFLSKDELERHSFKHTGERMHTCPMCGEEFPRSMQLTKHLRTHVGDFPYKCSQCGKAFRLKIQLIQHVRLHMAQDANACENCPAKFSTRTELQDHILQCHGETGFFKCHLCSKTFPYRYKLLNHLRLHTNVKCFQCYICHKTFATKHYLQRHLQVHLKQGMDVDVQNIVVDEDSKLELETVRKQMTFETVGSCENGGKNDPSDCLGIQSLKKNDFKRSISSFDVDKKSLKAERNGELEISASKNESKNDSFMKIKVEAPDETDIGSEDSFCSSLTRDSERSDPFKFSSDDSNSFKTAMWKERRRLKRRWRKNHSRSKCSQYDLNNVTKCEEMNGDIGVEVKDEDDEDEVMDMKVELNGVRSEIDDVMSIYVNLTHMKSLETSGKTPCVEESSISLRDKKNQSLNLTNSLKPILEQSIKDEIEDKSENQQPQASSVDNVDKEESDKGTAFVFDIDMEAFEDGQFKLIQHLDCEEDTEKLSLNESKKITKFIFPKEQSDLHLTESQLMHVKSEESLTSKSDLERLKASFENSSKYLPLHQTHNMQSESSHNQLQSSDHQKLIESSSKTEGKSVKIKKESHSENSQDCFINEFPTSSQALSRQKISVLPPLNKQSKHINEQKHQKDEMLFAKSDSHMAAPRPSNSHSTLSSSFPQSSGGNEKIVRNTPSAGKPNFDFNRGERSNNLELSHRVSTFPSSHTNISSFASPPNTQVLKPTASSAFMLSHPVSGPAYLPQTQEPAGNVNDNAKMYRNPSLESHQQYFQPSSQSLNKPISLPSLVSNRNPLSDSILDSGSKSAFSTLPSSSNMAGSSISAAVSSNSVNPNHIPVLPNLQTITNHPSFSLNPSSIFDTNNPTLRDMNMMDLVGSNHPPPIQPLVQPSLNMEPQANLEVQMRHALASSFGGSQNISMQPESPFVNVGNPSFGLKLGNVIHPVNQGLVAPSIAVNSGHLDAPLLNMGQVGRGDLMGQMRNSYESQDNFLVGSSGIIPQMPNNIGSVSINPNNSLPLNFGGLGSLHPGGLRPSNSLTIGNFACAPQNPGGFNPFDPINLQSTNVINGLNPSYAPIQGLGVQDNLRPSMQTPRVNVWNPSMILPPSNPQLPGATLNMIGGLNPGYFPNF